MAFKNSMINMFTMKIVKHKHISINVYSFLKLYKIFKNLQSILCEMKEKMDLTVKKWIKRIKTYHRMLRLFFPLLGQSMNTLVVYLYSHKYTNVLVMVNSM